MTLVVPALKGAAAAAAMDPPPRNGPMIGRAVTVNEHTPYIYWSLCLNILILGQNQRSDLSMCLPVLDDDVAISCNHVGKIRSSVQ